MFPVFGKSEPCSNTPDDRSELRIAARSLRSLFSNNLRIPIRRRGQAKLPVAACING